MNANKAKRLAKRAVNRFFLFFLNVTARSRVRCQALAKTESPQLTPVHPECENFFTLEPR